MLEAELKRLDKTVWAACRKVFENHADIPSILMSSSADPPVFAEIHGVKALRALKLFSDRFGNGEYDRLIEELGD